jgi:hypothetical protein
MGSGVWVTVFRHGRGLQIRIINSFSDYFKIFVCLCVGFGFLIYLDVTSLLAEGCERELLIDLATLDRGSNLRTL